MFQSLLTCLTLTLLSGVLPARGFALHRADPASKPDVGRALADLTAASAPVRAEAQRLLTQTLSLADLDLVTQAVLDSAEPELRWRLAEAVAGDGRNEAERLELASLLAGADPREGPRAVGRQALTSLSLRWLPGARRELDGRSRAEEELAETSRLRWSFDPLLSLGPEAARTVPQSFYSESLLVRAVDRLSRHSGESLKLIVTPEAAQIARDFESALARLGPTEEDPQRFQGTCIELMGVLSERYGLELEAHGIDRLQAPFVLLRERREATVERTMEGLLARWIRMIQEPESSPSLRRDAARALAASGLPAVLEWLTWRALERADAAALDGVLLAAGRGLAVPQLLSERGQARFLRLLDQSPAPTNRVARALGVFPGVDVRGRAFAPRLFEGYAQLDPAQRFVRLLASEARGARAEEVVRAAQWELEAGRAATAPELVLQALRTLAASGSTELPEGSEVPVERMLRQLAERPGEVEAFAVLASDFGLGVPRGLSFLEGLRGDAAVRVFVAWVGWLFDVGERPEDGLLAALRTLEPASAETPWMLVLRRQAVLGRVAEARAWTASLANRDRAQGGSIHPRLERALLLSGLADRDEAARLGGELLRSVNASATARARSAPEDLAALGSLVAGPLGREATEVLVDLIREAEGLSPEQHRALAQAARRARSEFLSEGRMNQAQSLNTSLRLATGARAHPLRREFRAPLWPPPLELEPIALEALGRRSP